MRECTKIAVLAATLAFLIATGCRIPSGRTSSGAKSVTIVCPSNASSAEKLAAKEIRRYLYLRTGELVPIVPMDTELPAAAGLIVVGQKDRPAIRALAEKDSKLARAVNSLKPQQYLLKTLPSPKRPTLLITGGDAIATLYGAYRFAEHLGVRFYLHGDTIPDERIALEIPNLNETGKPLFETRGIQPFHDFPEGPDWWNTDDYKAVIAQLPKLRMNFFGLHTYPQGGVGPEPAVWIGMPADFNEDGTVKFSYPSRHFATPNTTGAWGYKPMKTGDYAFGADQLFERDDFGPDYMKGMNPWPQMSPEKANELFDRMGNVLKESFRYAHALGVKTCLGTETPLIIPNAVKEHLKAMGKDPADPAVVQELYEGMFRRIAKTYPLDYYWFWTPEGWTWGGVKDEQVEATLADIRAAIAAAKKVNAPFTLATCGWVLGPPKDRALFDNTLPKEMPMSCINRNVGFSFVEPGFANVEARPQWAIPWLEDDPAMIIPQLWAGRMRRDAADALTYGCTGLLGIHWRTRILGPNVSALAHAAWDQTGWNPDLGEQAKSAEHKLTEGRNGGNVAAFPNNPMADTEEDTLYQTVIYDVKAYHLKVPNGAYTVTLKFCEPHYNETGKRVFGVRLQGEKVIGQFDIFAKVGKNRALDYTFEDVKVTKGFLSIDFEHIVEYPCIAGIVVKGPQATRKINCGGPAYKDYQADLAASASDSRSRDLPADDFYADWAAAQFGPEAAEPIAKLFVSLDGGRSSTAEGQGNTNLPRPSTWIGGPGGVKPDQRPWEKVSKEYAFVDELCELRPLVKGAGNVERFNYWVNNFRYLRAVGQVSCTWGRYNAAIKRVKDTKESDVRKQLARETVLPIRKELVARIAEVHRYLLATVNTPGAMGNVTNWQQHVMPKLLTEPGKELAKILGEELGQDAMPGKEYIGWHRLIVPTVRSTLAAGEDLRVKVIILPTKKAQDAALYWRPMGSGRFKRIGLTHVARAVYSATIPAEAIQQRDFEYYVRAEPGDRPELVFPAGAPQMTQTVVIMNDR
ncbi:MAG: hypothetical protein ISS79_12465 [Phycisphaerae bacterium]|nr:hypothetical protein [Phycisphaerae bacterium]